MQPTPGIVHSNIGIAGVRLVPKHTHSAMRILLVFLAVLASSLAAPTDFPEDEDHTLTLLDQESFTMAPEVPTSVLTMDETFVLGSVENSEPTTDSQELILTSPLPAVEVETTTTPSTTPQTRKTTTTPRTTTTSRAIKQEKTAPTAKNVPTTKSGSSKIAAPSTAVLQKTTSTTEATKSRFDEEQDSGIQRGKNEKLSDFLKRKKQERFLATTEADPFAAFFNKGSTTTKPSFKVKEEPIKAKEETPTAPSHSESFSSSGRSFSTGNKNRPGNRRNSAFGRTAQQTSAPTTSGPRTPVTAKPRNRFTGLQRNGRNTGSASATTPDTFVIDKPETPVETSTKAKSLPKRPSFARPVPNSISRKRDPAPIPSETSSVQPETVGETPVETNPRTTARRGSIRRVKGNRL